jgi:hypothetical protein
MGSRKYVLAFHIHWHYIKNAVPWIRGGGGNRLPQRND